MQTGDNTDLTMERPWQRRGPKRTPKQRLRLALGLLIGIYVANVAANVLYKTAMHWQVDLVHQRMESLARLDSDDPEIGRLAQMIDAADYSSLTVTAPQAVAMRKALTADLKRNPHLSLGIAIDGDAYTAERTTGLLRELNQHFRPHGLTVGLADAPATISIPEQSTRDDILRGITGAFRQKPDYVIALTTRRCLYTSATLLPGEPTGNRIYTFGRLGLTVVDGAVIGADLSARLQIELASFLRRGTRERRWRADDYALRPEEVLTGDRITVSLQREFVGNRVQTDEPRSVHISIGLDEVSPAEAHAAVEDVNALFRPHGIGFVTRHIYPHRLPDRWKWPAEVRKLMERGTSDIYVLLSASEWISPDRGPVRGLAYANVGAMMIQTGARDTTSRRLAHELGHLFGLPHTLLSGHVMYPNESRIGLRWSPGSDKLLARNKRSLQWLSSIPSMAGFDIAVGMAPEMRRSSAEGTAVQFHEAFARGDVWVRCGAD